MAGVVRVREVRKSRNMVVLGERGEGTDFSRYSGTGIVDARVGR